MLIFKNCISIVMALLVNQSLFFDVLAVNDKIKLESPPEQVCQPKNKSVFIAHGGGELISAISSYDYHTAVNLINMRKGFLEEDDNLCSPLHYAVRCGNFELTQLLIENGADVNKFDNWSRTPLALAQDEKIERLLIENGANLEFVEVNKRDSRGFSVLKNAVIRNNFAEVEGLLKRGAKPNILDRMKRTPLCDCESTEIAKLLLSFGAYIEPLDYTCESPIDSSIKRDRIDLLKFFVQRYDCGKKLPFIRITSMFHIIAKSGRLQMLKYVMDEAGIIRWLNSKFIGDIICLAVKYNHEKMIDYVLSKGININIQSTSLDTPLHAAVSANNAYIAAKFLSLGATVNAVNRRGQYPLDLVRDEEFLCFLDVYLDNMVSI